MTKLLSRSLCFLLAAASFGGGYMVKTMSYEASCDGCFSDCEDDLNAARDSLDRAYVISASGPGKTEIDLATARSLMANFETSTLSSIGRYKGMNLHLNHLEQMIRYHFDLGSTAHGGFRIYNGLNMPADGSPPTAADIVHIIAPLSTTGRVSMPADNIWSFGSHNHFELPCPTLCD